MVRFPKVKVKRVSEGDGATFRAAGRIADALRKAGVAKATIKEFYEEGAKSTSRDEFVATCARWVTLT